MLAYVRKTKYLWMAKKFSVLLILKLWISLYVKRIAAFGCLVLYPCLPDFPAAITMKFIIWILFSLMFVLVPSQKKKGEWPDLFCSYLILSPSVFFPISQIKLLFFLWYGILWTLLFFYTAKELFPIIKTLIDRILN